MKTFDQPMVYAVRHNNNKIVEKSRSGGVFTAISDVILHKGGIVYGCILNDDMKAVHVRATSFEERNLMRGSKYVQSDMLGTFESVKEDLESGKQVLFSGTSCQVDGLYGFLKKKYDKLYCIDIVCHGVPSPLVLEKYLEWIGKKYKGNVIKMDFRNKKDFGWREHRTTLFLRKTYSREEKDSEVVRVDDNLYTDLFYSHLILRPSCYRCPYKSILHPSDVTIADYWGIENAAPRFDDNKGVSLVMVNSESGLELFNSIKDSIDYQQTRIEDSMQKPLIEPYEQPPKRDEFWNDFGRKSFGYIARQYGNYGKLHKIKCFLGNIRNKILSRKIR